MNLTKYGISTNLICILIIWIFHLSGILGILYGNSEWFINLTPLNLSVSFFLLVYINKSHFKTIIFIISCFFVGMISEILGVNFGVIFGNYKYGEALGFKFFDVPLLIGANWAILTISCSALSATLFDSKFIKIIIGVFLMVMLDAVIEPIAPVLDFWEFDGGKVPLKNYLGWVIVAFPLNCIYHILNIKVSGSFTHHLYILNILFFSILLLQLNTLKNLI